MVYVFAVNTSGVGQDELAVVPGIAEAFHCPISRFVGFPLPHDVTRGNNRIAAMLASLFMAISHSA
jgi:hypothetical protein